MTDRYMEFRRMIAVIFLLSCFLSCFNAGIGTIKASYSDGNKVIIWETNRTIEEDYYVNHDETLIVKPGITIQFNWSISLIVNGTLLVEGADGREMVVFTSNNNTTEPESEAGYWGGIQFNQGSFGIIRSSSIEYATFGICIESSNPIIENCIIKHKREGSGILIKNGSNPVIYNNQIINNVYGIYAWPGSRAIVWKNNISNNLCGIGVYSSLVVVENELSNNHMAFTCEGASPKIIDCKITDSVEFDFYVKGASHPKLINTTIDKDKIKFLDDKSTLDNNGIILGNEIEKEEKAWYYLGPWGYGLMGFLILLLIALFIKKYGFKEKK